VYNGEIYNWQRLAKLTNTFEGNVAEAISDGDVLIPLYRRFGAMFPRLLDGEFALALVTSPGVGSFLRWMLLELSRSGLAMSGMVTVACSLAQPHTQALCGT